MNKSRGRGRPRGGTSARADILEAARRRFLADGYDHVTVRVIAADAGVDPALISYYFGSKKGLFGAVMALAANPAELLAREIPGPLNNLPDRLLRTVLLTWEDPDAGSSLTGFLHAVVRDPEVARVFREVIEQEMLTRIADRIGGPDATRRAAIASSHIAGLVMSRYVLRLEPLASMPPAEVIERMAPSLRAALLGPAPSRRFSTPG
jgi:AcrR family transcriptional regulator